MSEHAAAKEAPTTKVWTVPHEDWGPFELRDRVFTNQFQGGRRRWYDVISITKRSATFRRATEQVSIF